MTPAVVSLLTPAVVSYIAHFASEESTPGGAPILPSLLGLTPRIKSLNEHCMTPHVGSKMTPQPGSHICSFLVISTSEMSTKGLAATVAASLESPGGQL